MDEAALTMNQGYDVFVVGSINTDLAITVERRPLPGETIAGSDLVTSPGGKGGNQASAAARLGGRIALLARVGDDARGATLRAELRAMAVDDRYLLATSDVATGSAIITITPDGENSIVVSRAANARLAIADVESATADIRAAAVTLAQLEVPVDAVVCALELAASAGRRAILNAAPARRLPGGLLRCLDPLVVNEGEASFYYGEPVTPESAEAAAIALVARGARSVVITLGGSGAAYASARGSGRVAAPPVDVVDTTGAGDAFTGALALELARGATIKAAVTLAVRVGSFAVRKSGAQASLPRREELV